MTDKPTMGEVRPESAPMTDAAKIALAKNLFRAWSYRGGPGVIEQFAHPDIVIVDAHIGELRGLANIMGPFKAALAMWPDMDYEIGDIWVNERGAAVTWVMTGTVTQALAPKYGAALVGRKWRSAGMSSLAMRDGRVFHEHDHYDPAGTRKSLGLGKPAKV